MWLYACSILVAVLVYCWVTNLGDAAFGRLETFPAPAGSLAWIHIIPPLFILALTRFGVPVSTTFLVLTVFAPTNLGATPLQSLIGYGVAIVAGLALYLVVARFLESHFIAIRDHPPGAYWVALQWLSTAFLRSQWLIQDLANIFVYLPRTVGIDLLLRSIAVMLALHALIFRKRGGPGSRA